MASPAQDFERGCGLEVYEASVGARGCIIEKVQGAYDMHAKMVVEVSVPADNLVSTCLHKGV